MKAFLRPITTPVGAVWILSHTIVVLVGIVFLVAAPLHDVLGKGISEAIGGSLIAGGIAGITLFLYVLTTEGLKSRIEAFSKAGVLKIFSGRSVLIRDEYHTRLAKARHIDLVGFGLSSFREDYINDFVDWSHRADVRILLIDPDFPTRQHSLADQRDREENNPVGQIRRDVEAFERAVSALRDLDREKFKVHRMRSIPAINFFRIDDDVFWGPYLMRQQSRNTPTLLATRGGFLFDMLQKHFDALWAQSSPSPLS
jgi:hypothetical protein